MGDCVGAGTTVTSSRRAAGARCLALLLAVMLAGCGTPVADDPVSSPPASSPSAAPAPSAAPSAPVPQVDPARLDTGDYATAPLPPLGVAGNADAGRRVESHRMAPFVTGPWQVDEALRVGSSPAASIVLERDDIGLHIWPFLAAGAVQLPFVVGFVADRRASADSNEFSVRNEVLRFADDGAAAAAAVGIVHASQLKPPGEPAVPVLREPVRMLPVPGRPDSTGLLLTFDENGRITQEVTVVTAHGPYLLVQVVRSPKGPDDAVVVAARTLDLQIPLIDGFRPTDPAQFATLPLDPTGVVARTLPRATIDETPMSGSAYPPAGALHAEDDPVLTAPQWAEAGVDEISLGLATVYRAKDVASATRLVTQLGDAAAARPSSQPAEGVPGLPGSRCIQVSDGAGVAPKYLCLGTADRYVLKTLARDLDRVQEQLAAQYRMLTG